MRKLLPLFVASFCVVTVSAQSAAPAKTTPLICVRVESDDRFVHPHKHDLADLSAAAIRENEHIAATALNGPFSDVDQSARELGCSHLLRMNVNFRKTAQIAVNPSTDPKDPAAVTNRLHQDEYRLDLTYVAHPLDQINNNLEGETFREVQLYALGPGKTVMDKLNEISRSSARVAARKMKKKWKL